MLQLHVFVLSALNVYMFMYVLVCEMSKETRCVRQYVNVFVCVCVCVYGM